MHLTNVLGLPSALLEAVRNDPYTPGNADISATKLIDSPQIRQLTKKYGKFVVEDVSERIWSLLGQSVHTILERAGTNQLDALHEKRLFMDVNGWRLSGAFDRLHLEDETLQDYKVTSTYKADGDISWERQLNVLRQLALANGYGVKKLQIVAIFRDWSRAKAKQSRDYPQAAVKVIEVPVWDDAEARDYIHTRISMHQAADAGEKVVCTDEERWYSGSRWALMKEGNKRATKLADTKEELGDPPPKHYIEERKGGYRRCEEYCPVAGFCPQFQKDAESGNQEAA